MTSAYALVTINSASKMT